MPRRRPRPSPAPAAPRPPEPVALTIPSAGPATFAAGWWLPWRVLRAQLSRPFAPLRLLLAAVAVFTLVKMTGIYLVGVLWWGGETPDPGVQRWMNAGLWQMGSWLLAPAALTPWLAASVVFAHGLPLPWRLVKEPLDSRSRLIHLAVLGGVGLVVAGAMGASAGPASARWGTLPAVLAGAAAWAFTQATLMAATAGVWRDGVSSGRALRDALMGWRWNWKPVLASSLATLLLAVVAGGLLVATFAGPFLAMGIPARALGWVGFVALPVIVVLWGWWCILKASLALAFLQWGEPPALAQGPTQDPEAPPPAPVG